MALRLEPVAAMAVLAAAVAAQRRRALPELAAALLAILELQGYPGRAEQTLELLAQIQAEALVQGILLTQVPQEMAARAS